MEDILRQALVILRATWKHRHLGMLVAWVVGAVAAGVILRIPDRYEASARIYVDTQSILKPLMSGLAVQPNIEQQVMMLSRTLISRPNVEKVIRMADLDLKINGKAEQEALIDGLTKTLKIQSVGRDNLYTLSYQSTDPAQAQRVVQALVSIFVESSLGEKRQDSDSARKFIDEQIQNYEKKLQEAESRLKDYKLRNVELHTGEGRSGIDQLSSLTTELNSSRLALREAENSRDAMAQGQLFVASDVGGHKELVEHNKTGILFKAGDRQALADAIINLLNNQPYWPVLKANGRQFVETTRNWRNSVANYRAPYAQLLKKAV